MKHLAKNATSSKNCLTCSLFSSCSYTAKSPDFRCDKFKTLEAVIITGKKKKKTVEATAAKKTTFHKVEGAELPKSELDRLIKSSSDPSARDFRKYLRQLAKSDSVIFSDPRIDDRDFKRAPNFFTWCTGKKFLNQEPYAKQLQLGINFYSEWCPRCSNRDYVADIPIDAKPADILSNVTFFKHGVCPKCGLTKSEAILNNELPQYQDLTAIVGQRGGKCISGSSWITTSFGLVRMKDLVENKLESVSDEYGHAHSVNTFWDKGSKKVYTLHTSTGHSLICTPEHPLLTLKGWIPAKNLPQNEALPINIRQENLVPSYIWMAWINGNPHATASLANFARIEMGSPLDVLSERLYSLGQRTAENFIFNTGVEDWVFESIEKPLHKRELSTAFMCMPLDFYKGFFHTCFFSKYQIDVKVRFHHLSKAILKQLQLLLGNIGFFSRIDAENGLIIEGRQVLELIELTRALVTDTYGTAAPVSQGRCNYAEHEAWYDTFPESARRHVQNLIANYVQDVEKSIQETHGDYSDLVSETGTISKQLEQVRAFSRYCVDEIIREDANRILACMQEISVYHTQFAHRLYQAFKEICRKDQAWTELKHINKRNNTAHVYDIEVPKTRRFLANGLLVHNSVAVSHIASYALHDHIMIKDPSKYFGIANTILHGTITAHTYAQAKEAVWDPIYDLLSESPWFSQYHDFLSSKGNELGEELFKLKDTFVMYRHRGLQMAPSGPSKKTLRGRCLVGSTFVSSNKGFLTLKELCNNEKKGFTREKNLLVDSHTGIKKVSHSYVDRSKTIKLITRNGYTLEGTFEHPVLVLTEDLKYKWRKLKNIKTGDWIVSKTKQSAPQFGNGILTKDNATILGYFVANGFRDGISSGDNKVIKRFRKVIKRVTGKYPRSFSKHSAVPNHQVYGFRYSGATRENPIFRKYLATLGYTATSSKNKEIPISVRQASKEVMHEFLEAYFECDSGINGGGTHGNRERVEIEVGSASKKLVSQLHYLLLHYYGIVGRIQHKVIFDAKDRITGEFNARRDAWIITITGYDAWLFQQTFKRAKIQKYKDRIKFSLKGKASDRRKVPYINAFIYKMYDNRRLNVSPIYRGRRLVLEDGTVVINKIRPKCLINLNRRVNPANIPASEQGYIYSDAWNSYYPFLKKLWKDGYKRIKKVIDLDAHYEEVIKIVPKVRKTQVYDLTIPDGHCFYANGLASHNTRFYCLDGDSLVATDRGLVPIKDANILSNRVDIGGEKFSVKRHLVQGKQKVVKLHLENGEEIICTPDHKFPALLPDFTTKLLPASQLKDKYLQLDLGGSLGKGEFNFEVPKQVSRGELAIRFMFAKKKFMLAEVGEASGRERSITAITSIMRKNGHLSRKKLPSKFMQYTLESDDLDYLLKTYCFYAGDIKKKRLNFITPTRDSFELGWIIGSLICDGSYNSNVEWGLTSTQYKKMLFTQQAFKKVFGVSLPLKEYSRLKDDTSNVYKNAYRLTIGTNHIKDFLRYCGLSSATARKKSVPWAVLQGTQDMIYGYLAACLLHDGSIISNHRVFSSVSKKLLRQMQALLAHIGVLCHHERGTLGVLHLEENSPVIAKILGRVPFNKVKHGKNEVKTHIRNRVVFSKTNLYYERIPYRKINYEGYGFYTERARESALRQRRLTRKEVKWVESLPDYRRFLKVVKITNLKKKREVYDISVSSKEHLFRIGTGIYTSNCTVDELGWFSEDESKVKASGMEVVKALTRSLQTLRSATRRLIRQGVNDFPMPIMCNISSPSDINDPIMQLSRRAEKPGSRMYCVQYPTWEFNPDITFEDLASEFSDDPDGAWRDFGARPPMSALAFISDIKHFKGIANRNTINAATVQQKIVKTRSQQLMTGATLQWNWTDDSVGKLLCIDPGAVSNSFSFSVSHMDPEIGLVFDLLGEVIPKRDYPINFNHLYENVLADICLNMNIKAVGGDRWQNLKIIHDLENDFGINWFEVRLKYPDFLNFREALYQGDFRLPGLEMPTKDIVEITSEGYPRCFLKKPIAHFVYQSLTVQDNAPKSVDKAPGMTDDLFRVVVLAHAMMQDPTVAELLEGQVETPLTGGIAARNTGVAVASLGDIASRNNASSGNITELGAIGNRTNATSL